MLLTIIVGGNFDGCIVSPPLLIGCYYCCYCYFQAFIKTAENIYEKIKDGLYDPSREGNGVKLGVMASAPKAGKKAGGGCC